MDIAVKTVSIITGWSSGNDDVFSARSTVWRMHENIANHMSDFSLDVTVYDVRIDSHLDRLIRSTDPYLRERLEKEVKSRLVSGNHFPPFQIPEADLKRFALTYGE